MGFFVSQGDHVTQSQENTASKGLAEPELLALPNFLRLLGSLYQLHRLPFDPLLIERQLPPPSSVATLDTVNDALNFRIIALVLHVQLTLKNE